MILVLYRHQAFVIMLALVYILLADKAPKLVSSAVHQAALARVKRYEWSTDYPPTASQEEQAATLDALQAVIEKDAVLFGVVKGALGRVYDSFTMRDATAQTSLERDLVTHLLRGVTGQDLEAIREAEQGTELLVFHGHHGTWLPRPAARQRGREISASAGVQGRTSRGPVEGPAMGCHLRA